MDAKNRLIFALDVPDKEEALDLVRSLRDEVGRFKLGLELYLAHGPGILNELANQVGPQKIFLDLKLFDIPATVLGAIRTFLHGLAWITLPSDLGPTGLKKIVESTALKVLAVTVLTSAGANDLLALGYDPSLARNPENLVVHKALLAQQAGCAGVVCSGREARAVRDACGRDFLIVCPGIRPLWSLVPGDDQSRIVTPYEAIRNGADYIVVGRPIRQAAHPARAARQVVAEIKEGLSG